MLRSNPKYAAGLLVAAVAIIALGIAIKPKEKRREPVSEIESLRLQRLTQERRLQDLGDYLSYTAQNAAKSLVYVSEMRQTGLIIRGDGTVATAFQREVPEDLTASTSSLTKMRLRSASTRPDVPVLLLRAGATTPIVVTVPEEPATGDWVLAVALRDDARPVFAYGLYENTAPSHCGPFEYRRLRASIPLTSVFLGGGLFTLRGAPAGIVARCGDDLVIVSMESVLAAVEKPISPADLLEQKYGLRLSVLDAAKPPAMEVLSVWQDSPAARAGIRSGDRITGAGESPDLNNLVQDLLASPAPSLRIRRGSRTIQAHLESSPRGADAGLEAAGLALADKGEGRVQVLSVADGSAAARAGVLPGDVLLRVGSSTPGSAAAAAKLLRETKPPVPATFERNGARFEGVVAR